VGLRYGVLERTQSYSRLYRGDGKSVELQQFGRRSYIPLGHGKGMSPGVLAATPVTRVQVHSQRAYLDAWRHVASLLKNEGTKSAVSSFAANWTSPEFEEFVKDLADLVDNLEIPPGSKAWEASREHYGQEL